MKKLVRELNYIGVKTKTKEPLKSYTTWKIGGPADIFVEARTREELVGAINAAKQTNTKFTILGWGSNVLISDKGIRGLVIRNLTNDLSIYDAKHKGKILEKFDISPRLVEIDTNEYYTFQDLDYDESDTEKAIVNIESGAFLPATIMKLIREGITGLQWFGGIPGTLGGAIYNNIHGGSHYLSEYIKKVEIYDPETDKTSWLDKKECKFGYDQSRFHDTNEIILSADLILYKGNAKKAKEVYIEWTRRKKKQPQISAGCVWQNVSEDIRKRLELESPSWGYIIDKILGLKGKQIGGAKISENHAAFIENTGNAKATDVLALMDLIRRTSLDKLGIEPEPEVFLLGEY